MERTMVDMKTVKGLCANGIPFNVLRNPHFIEMDDAIKKAPSGYKPPSFDKARTVLLDECVRDVEKDLMPVKDTWYTQGVSIVSDGWSNVKRKPLINALAVNSRGATFMYAEDFSGVEISKLLLGAIDTIGPSNVLQVVTDNAANCKAARREIEKVYRHIFWSPCCVHTLNLIFKDLSNEFLWLRDTYKRVSTRWRSEKDTKRRHRSHKNVMEAFERIAENKEEDRVLREQFVTFHMKKGIYAMALTQADALTLDAIDWWSMYGSETRELAEVAKKVLSQPISSSSAEKNWSTYSYIHNVKTNRLNSKRADKLVFIHSNVRLLSRFSESYKSGPHKKWDVNPESMYIEGSSARLEYMAWENLDDKLVDSGKGKRPRVD
ncbi:hypothetical protein OSB04_001598 [Centaurea solstitialis]|uniref:DUF659 domain-containing protein n=1 Tax=Centaurea solstitialis TaxID=347529 RepID=A0AA38U9F8_9ASTR|nr:hypothetical protein OSB04_001598 [Centaurea solstitialis]